MKTKIVYGIAFTLLSCGQQNPNPKSIDSTTKDVVVQKDKGPEICKIKGEEIIIREGPGLNSKKLINQKATEMLNETQYAKVDYTCKVIIDEEKGDWSKIRVVEPEHLSNSHIGWIPTKNIIRKDISKKNVEKLDTALFEVIKTIKKPTVWNYYILIKSANFNKDLAIDFIAKFRTEYCSKSSNLFLYDSKTIMNLIDIYPLEGNNYIKVADHFLAMSSFDSPDLIMWYPYQDLNYKNYGGKNWKKEPIK